MIFPEPLRQAGLLDRLLFRIGLVRRHRYTDSHAARESLEVRLDSTEAAVGAQRERLADLQDRLNRANATVHDQLDRLCDMEEAATELRGELAAAEQELAELKAAAEDASTLPPAVVFDERRRALLRDRAADPLLEAVGALLGDEALSLSSDAIAQGLSPEERSFRSGQAYGVHGARMRLRAAMMPK